MVCKLQWEGHPVFQGIVVDMRHRHALAQASGLVTIIGPLGSGGAFNEKCSMQ